MPLQRLLLLVCAAGLLAAALFFVAQTSERAPGPDAATAVDGAESAGEVDQSSLAKPEAAAEDRVAGESNSVTEAAATRSERSLRGALTVEGGGEPGEPVRVVARTKDAQEEVARSKVALDGSFELLAPRDAGDLTLTIEAEFLALPSRVDVEANATEPLALVARRGACVLVELTGSGAAHPEAQLGPDFQLEAGPSASTSRPRGAAFRGADGQIRLGGVHPDEAEWIALRAPRFATVHVSLPALRVGERTIVQLEVTRGFRLSGTVMDAEGEPVQGADIRLSSWEHADRQSTDGLERRTTSDADGAFEVGGVLAGDMTLRVFADGFDMKREELGAQSDGASIEGLELVLVDGGVVRGTVQWADASPVKGAQVCLGSIRGSLRRNDGAVTEADGTFEIRGVRGGPFRLLATKKGKGTTGTWSATGTAALGQDVVLVLQEGSTLSGRVVDDAGEPVREFAVLATPVGRNGAGPKQEVRGRSKDGAFELKGLFDGDFDLVARGSGYVSSAPVRISVHGGSRAPQVLVMHRLVKVRGMVVDTGGAPIAGVPMRLGTRKTASDEEGRFEVGRVRPGEMTVRILDSAYGVVRSPRITLVPGADRDDVTIVLARGSRVLGRMHPSLTGGIHRNANLRRQDEFAMESAKIQEDGTFVFDGLSAGSYWVSLAPVKGREFSDAYRDTRPIPIEVPMDTDVEVVVGAEDSYPLAVSGRVTKAGEPQAGMLMYVYQNATDRTFPAVITRTDADGRYECSLRVPGRYAFNVGEGQTAQARFVVDVTDKREQENDFELPDRALRGQATLADGTPAAGRFYVLVHADAPVDSVQVGELQFTNTKSDGSFAFEGIHPGEYRLRTGNYTTGHDLDGIVIVKGIKVPAEGSVDEVSVRIPPAALVQLRVTGPGDAPLAGCDVRLVDEDGSQCVLYDTRRTDAAGRIRKLGVGPGRWTVVVRDPGGAVIGQEPITVAAGELSSVTIRCDA